MIFKNNNTKIVKEITNRSLKANKTRNVFVLLSIILTTFMIGSVLTMSYNIVKNTDIMNDRLSGASADILLNMPTDDQIEYVKNANYVENVGIMIINGTVESDKLDEINKRVDLIYYDEEGYQNQIVPAVSDIEGKYPTEYNEIMLSTKSIEYLGLDGYKIGDKIDLKVKNYDKTINEETFVISGIYYDYATAGRTTKSLVSEQYVLGKNQTVENNGYVMIGTKFLKENDVLNNLETNLTLDQRQTFKATFYSAKNYIGIIIGVVISIIFLIFTGFLLTYNVIQISVNKDINFYGLLKTIGMSGAQIKKVVKNQVISLSIIGIPIGLLTSYLVCLGLYGYMSKMVYNGVNVAMPMTVDMNIFIIIFTILFSLFTIYLSCRKPAKIASKVSPVEAIRYTGISNNYKRKSRKTTSGGKIYKIAWYNVFRNGKRSMIVFVSLFMGIMTCLCAVTFTSTLNLDNYIKFYLPYDVEITYNYNSPEDFDFFTNDKINEIKNVQSVSNVTTIQSGLVQIELDDEIIMNGLRRNLMHRLNDEQLQAECNRMKNENNGFAMAKIVGINDDVAEKIYDMNSKSFDLEAFKRGEIAIIGSFYVKDRQTGDIFNNTLEIKSIDNEVKKEFEVISLDTTGAFGGVDNQNGLPNVFVSENSLNELSDVIKVQSIYFNCSKDDEKQFVEMANNNNLYIELKSETTDSFQKSIVVMNGVGGAIGFVLILIGVLNFINIIITNMDSRKRELAFLESIGMTKKQIRKMITYEGLYYAIITTILTLIIGSPILSFIGKTMEKQDPYIVYTYPAKEVIVITLFIYVVCLTIPKIVYNKFSKESIIERSK